MPISVGVWADASDKIEQQNRKTNMSVTIDAGTFHRRLSVLQQHIVASDNAGLLLMTGANDDNNIYKKTTVAQTWLLGYEFPHTAMFVSSDKCIVVTSESKTKHLQKLPEKPSPNSLAVEIWTRTKEADKNRELFERLKAAMVALDGPIGRVDVGVYEGKFIEEWKAVEAVKNEDGAELKYNDAGLLLSEAIGPKDDDEIALTQTAANASVVMVDAFANEMVLAVDSGRKTTNLALSEKLEDLIELSKWYTKGLGKKLLGGETSFDPDLVEWCYSPIIQSGGDFDLKVSASSKNKKLAATGVVLALIGLRYKSYCSNLARTFLIDPTPTMESTYDFLLELQKHVVSLLKSGAEALAVYNGAADYVKEKKPALAQQLTRNCGFLTGIEFRDSFLVLNAKTDRKLKENEVFSLTVGFHNVDDEKGSAFSMQLTDTYRVTAAEPVALTTYAKERPEISFKFEDLKVKNENSNDADHQLSRTDAQSRNRTRNEQAEDETNAEQIRQEQQKRLHEKRQQEGLSRFSKEDAADGSEQKPIFKRYESYVRESQIPLSVRDLRIHVDYKSQTILIPISGRPVVFHINAFKNGLHNEEGDFTYLRLNFNSPGAGAFGAKRAELPYEDDPDFQFLRSVTLRLRDHQRMVDVYKAIADMKKDAMKREQERKQMADVITQASLVELKGSRVRKLDQVYVRPQPDTKKIAGVLQIHENGLRYLLTFKSDHKVDVLFSNIKHLFFQPCKDELIVLIHCHLKSPIMIGKKKTMDVQFYREASEMSFDETGGRKRKYRYGDEDELQQEQEERRRKAALDKEFKAFTQVIVDSLNGMVDAETPFRELGFQGVPFRLAVFCMPTAYCLVSLIDPPYLVITLEEIEIAQLERVQFGLKNFDLVFVFKDFKRPVAHINSIPMEVLEDVKSWLTDVDIPYSEWQMNLNWPAITKTVQADPYQFFEDGGWSILAGDDSEEEESEEEESEFEASDPDPSDEEDSVSEEDNYSESDSGSGSAESESEGEDWDEMERKAAKEDSGWKD